MVNKYIIKIDGKYYINQFLELKVTDDINNAHIISGNINLIVTLYKIFNRLRDFKIVEILNLKKESIKIKEEDKND